MDKDSSGQPADVTVPAEAIALGAYGAKFLPLLPDSKRPQPGGYGRSNARTWDEFFKLDHQNYGIALDGWALVVDLDKPDNDSARLLVGHLEKNAPPTWRQRTRKGKHWLFLLPPGGQPVRGGNLVDGQGEIYGQILCNAYIVGPGSRIDGTAVYELEDGRAPVIAPEWLIDRARNAAKTTVSTSVGPRRDTIPRGEHDNALASILGQIAKSHAALSESALASIADFIANKSGILDSSDGYDRQGITRLVRSAISIGDRKPEVDGIAMLPAEWRTGDDVDSAPIPTRWLEGLAGLIPAVGAALLYGDGKVGKTTLLAWLAAQITAAGKGVIYMASGETTFDEFIRMVALYDKAQIGMVYEYPNPGLFTLPSKCIELEKALEVIGSGIAAVMIDAVYSHFEPTEGHEATRARHCLKPLNEVSQRRALSILCTIHENASGGMLGSREMRNVARSVVHAVRKPGFPLTVYGAGANVPQVDYGAVFDGTPIPLLDSNNQPIVYRDFLGDAVPQQVWKLDLSGKAQADTAGGLTYGIDQTGGISFNTVPDDKKRT